MLMTICMLVRPASTPYTCAVPMNNYLATAWYVYRLIPVSHAIRTHMAYGCALKVPDIFYLRLALHDDHLDSLFQPLP